MPALPVHCPHCGHTFLSNISMRNVSIVGGGGMFGVRCPQCGKQANDLKGDFEFTDSAMIVKSAPQETVTKLEKLREALKAAQADQDIEAVLTPLQEVSPQLAALARTTIGRGGMAAVVAMLLYLLASCAQNTKGTINWNQIVDQAHVYVTGAEPYPGLGSTPEPQSTGTVEGGRQSQSEGRSGPSRQQRRQLERQSKKQQQRIERPSAQKPSSPKKPRK